MIDRLTVLLRTILQSEQPKRNEAIQEYQQLLWDTDETIVSRAVDEVLRDLAYDIEFYVEDEERRREDPTYYGDEKLVQEVDQALRRLAEECGEQDSQ